MRPRGARGRRAVAGLIALLWVTYAASAFVEPAVESGLRDFAARKADTATKPAVRVSAFPIVPRLLAGRIPALSVDARDSMHAGWRVARLRVDLRDLRVSWRAFLGGSREVIVGRGTWIADVDEEAFADYVARHGVQADFSFRRGEATMRRIVPFPGGGAVLTASGRPSIQARPLVKLVLSLSPGTVAGAPVAREEAVLSILLPPLPGGVAIDAVEVIDGALRFTAVETNWRHDAAAEG